MPKITWLSGNHGTIVTFMPALPQETQGQILESLLHNTSYDYKDFSTNFNAKNCDKSTLVFALSFLGNSGCLRRISMGEHPNEKTLESL